MAIVNGTPGNDTLLGGTPLGDTIDGGLGSDTMQGDLGGDTYHVDDINDRVVETSPLATEIDQVFSSVTWSLAYPGAQYVEVLTLTGASDINATGNALNNLLTGNSGNNTIIGADGNDTLSGESNETVSGGNDRLDGGNGDDELRGFKGDDLLLGGAGNDTLDGGAGEDSLTGGAGNDLYVVDNTNDVISETSATDGVSDEVQSSVSWALGANLENLRLKGVAAIVGDGNSLKNTIYGNIAHNSLSGFGGDDVLWGEDGNDTVNGGAGNDTLYGGNGDDMLVGGAGIDSLSGGNGRDTYVVDSLSDRIDENGTTTTTEIDTVIVRGNLSWQLGAESRLENLTLTGAYNNTATGNELHNLITGNAGNNVLYGGSAGNDTLNGGVGVDTMDGGTDGNDTYYVDNVGDSVIEAGVSSSQIDTIISSIDWSIDTVSIQNNLVNIENLTLIGDAVSGTGNAKNNLVIGNAQDNVLEGLNGNDTLDGGTGNDLLIGGAGNDSYVVDSMFDIVEETGSSTSEVDTVSSSISWTLGANIERLSLLGSTALNGAGNALNNTLTGNSGANILHGMGGNDTLSGGSGNDTLIGGAGVDSLDGGIGNDTYLIDAGDRPLSESTTGGVDTVKVGHGSYTLLANFENLVLTGALAINGAGNSLGNSLIGNTKDNLLSGLEGNDTLQGGGGNDTLNGGAGNDVYYVNAYALTLIEIADAELNSVPTLVTTKTPAEASIDTVITSIDWTLATHFENLTLGGSDVIDGTGNTSANVIIGNAAANTLIGLDGDDSLNGGAGADWMDGGTGNDIYVVDTLGDAVIELSTGGVDTIQSSINWTLTSANVENLTLTGAAASGSGNSLANTIMGNGSSNTLSGLAGNDLLYGEGGNDSIFGGNGNDFLGGGAGKDAITGGYGNDTLDGGTDSDSMNGGYGADVYYVDNALDSVMESVVSTSAAEKDVVYSSVTWTLGANVENLTLVGTLDIHGTGNELNNVLIGNLKSNATTGGNNRLLGGLGNDSISGLDGNDTLEGGEGNDLLIGGAGKDMLVGGNGNDRFDFNHLTETGTTGVTWDVITDFVRGQDRIDLSTLDANTATAANDAFSGALIDPAVSFTAAGQLRFVSGVLYGNVDADADAEFAVALTGVAVLSAADFIL